VTNVAYLFAAFFRRWRICVRCRLPYRDEDLVERLEGFLCRWHHGRAR
jgi:hypothetical protein